MAIEKEGIRCPEESVKVEVSEEQPKKTKKTRRKK
jgi:hypothetical protein